MNGKLRLWGIYYTHPNGSKMQYMAIGFKSEDEAQIELDKILRAGEKWRLTHDISDYDITRLRSFQIGTDWVIEEIKVKAAM